MVVPLLTAEQIRQMIPALHRQASGHVILSDVYAIGLAYGVIRVFERRTGGRVVATLGTLATDAGAILATLENLGQAWPDGATSRCATASRTPACHAERAIGGADNPQESSMYPVSRRSRGLDFRR